MNGPADGQVTTHELQSVNRELAALLHTKLADLTFGADSALQDELIICGILGGKDVGKSTLINALAKTDVSVDTAEVGKGTERPMVYVHEAMREAVTHRLHAIDRHVSLDITPHAAEPIRNMVLVDLPDFDSEFLDHLQQVHTIAPLLDRILWVVTPRKIGDRAWVRMFQDVIKDPSNVHCVLNKVDELLADSEPLERNAKRDAGLDTSRAAAFWYDQHRWVARVIDSAGCPQTDNHRFLVAAAFPEPQVFVSRIGRLWNDTEWTKYSVDRDAVEDIANLASQELDRLRACILSPMSAEEGRSVKAANRERERRVNVERIRRYYDLDRTVERLAQACNVDYQQQVLNEAAGADYCSAVASALRAQLRRDPELADEVLERRVEHWPLLRLVYWPFGWLSRLAGRRVSTPSVRDAQRQAADSETRVRRSSGLSDPFDANGYPLVDRVELMRSRILADHAVIARQLDLESELPSAERLAERVRTTTVALVPRLEAWLIDDIRRQDRRPSILGKAALWLIFLWFPFLQPILAGALEMFAETGTLKLAHGLYRIVSALSATHLLAGFAVVVGIYVALIAVMYARALRAVHRLRSERHDASPIATAIDEILVSQAIVPLAQPFQDRLEHLAALEARLAYGGSMQEDNDA